MNDKKSEKNINKVNENKTRKISKEPLIALGVPTMKKDTSQLNVRKSIVAIQEGEVPSRGKG